MTHPDLTISPDDLVAYAKLVQEAELAAWNELNALDTPQLVERGYAIDGLRVFQDAGSTITLACATNTSRIRIGDLVQIIGGGSTLDATVTRVEDAGRQIECALENAPKTGRAALVGSQTVTMRLRQVDMGELVMNCLNRLVPGAPGFRWFRHLSGATSPPTILSLSPNREPISDGTEMIDALERESGLYLDGSQRAALSACIERPEFLAVQGPPGTGKTRLLAFVAEALTRLGLRVVIVAPTHQSVNNALSAIALLFPKRRLLKVGASLRNESLEATVDQASFVRKKPGRPKQTDIADLQISGMTVMSALAQLAIRSSSLAPNVVLVEEAGQLPLHIGAALGLSGAGNILCFGDDKQMPPVFPEAVDGKLLTMSLFSRIRQVAPSRVITLTTTYRLNSELAHAIGGAFYDGVLQSHPSIAGLKLSPVFAKCATHRHVSAALDPLHALVWLQSPAGQYTQMNRLEAIACADIITACLSAGMQPEQLAIATPFRRHAAEIRRILQQTLGDDVRLPIIDTVERVQGLTVDVAIFSLCASDAGYVSQTAGFLFSNNRLNVALSRARTKAILIASPEALAAGKIARASLSMMGAWQRLSAAAHTIPIRPDPLSINL